MLRHINIAQASLGDIVQVPTLEGEAELAIPAGTQWGTELRISGQGLPTLRSARRGDLVVVIRVDVPEHVTERQQELLAALAQELGTDVNPPERGFFERMKEALGGK